MNTLTGIASGIASVLASQAWKTAAAALAILMLVGGGGGGALWWAAAAARDQAQADLAEVRERADGYQAAIREQNRAAEVLAKAKLAAEARATAALAQAAVARQRYDAALLQLAGARATTCTDAMPYVNKMLEEVR